MIELVASLQARLEVLAKPEKRRWWERYLKGDAAFRGVPMGDVRRAVHAWYADYRSVLTRPEKLALAGSLIRERMTEDKLAGILRIQEILVPAGEVEADDLPLFASWFDDGHLADWNVVDWFSVKALWSLVKAKGEPCARKVLAWSDAANLWRARASIVTFANTASKPSFIGFGEAVLEAASHVIRRPERFAKTGVGWVLAGLGEAEPESVERFVRGYLPEFTTEALRNATKSLRPAVAEEILRAHRDRRPPTER